MGELAARQGLEGAISPSQVRLNAAPAAARSWAKSRMSATPTIIALATPTNVEAIPRRGNPAACRRKHMREEALEQQFTDLLGRLHFDDDVLEWVRDALHASHAEECREHDEAIKRLEAECKRLDDRIHAMYADKLHGLIDAAFFQKMSNQRREAQDRKDCHKP
jgi:hypothetical protein